MLLLQQSNQRLIDTIRHATVYENIPSLSTYFLRQSNVRLIDAWFVRAMGVADKKSAGINGRLGVADCLSTHHHHYSPGRARGRKTHRNI